MSHKGTMHMIPKPTHTYIGEHESDEWSALQPNHPLFAFGAGSYSELTFGTLHTGKGFISKISWNAYPVEDDHEMNVSLLINNVTKTTLKLSGITGTIHLSVPIQNEQFALHHQSNTYTDGRTCLRVYVEITQLT
jgi:hypothetical protein